MRSSHILVAVALLACLMAACQVTPTPTLIPIPTATYFPTETPAPPASETPFPTSTPTPVRAVVTDTLRVRELPNTDARILGRLRKDTQILLLGRKDDNQWFLIEYPPGSGTYAWVAADFVIAEGSTADLPVGFHSSAPPPGAIFANTTDTVRVRSGPGTEYDILSRLPTGARVTLDARVDRPDGVWYQIIFPPDSDKHAWIKGEFLIPQTTTGQLALAEPPPTPTPGPTPIPKPSRGPIAPTGGNVLITSNRDGPSDIYSVAENGVVRARLTKGGQSFGGRFSPDGSRVVLYRVISTAPSILSHIIVMNANGSNAIDLSRGGPNFSDSDPDWSPDGKRIAFVRTPRAGAPEIWAMNPDGSGAHRIVSLSASTGTNSGGYANYSPQPRWSPDGGRLAFAAVPRVKNPGVPLYPSIFTINSDGTNEAQLTDNDLINSRPVWSPDGKQIAWSAKDFINRLNWQVWAMNASGGNQRALTTSVGGDANSGVQAAEWLGNRLLLGGWTGNWNAYFSNSDGSAIAAITREGSDDMPTDWLP